jgi:hypothetical protein
MKYITVEYTNDYSLDYKILSCYNTRKEAYESLEVAEGEYVEVVCVFDEEDWESLRLGEMI